jgi:hypothetical protein
MKKVAILGLLLFASWASPAIAADNLSKMSTDRLCSKYGDPGSKLFMRPDVKEEIESRGAGYCLDPRYIAAKRAEQQRQADALIQFGEQLRQMDNNRRARSVGGNGAIPNGVVGIYIREQLSGINKICYYNRAGSMVALTISAASICPLQY